MGSPLASLARDDVFELAAVLSGVARVRRRFLPFGSAGPAPTRSIPSGRERFGRERTTALARAELYNFLAASFAEPPSAAYLDGLQQSGAIPLLTAKGFGGEDFRLWAETLGPHRIGQDLPQAYSQVFIRPGPQHAPLLATAYLPTGWSNEGAEAAALSHGPAAEAVEAAYVDAGLVVGGDGPIAPQHLTVELQFMHHCAACEAAAWGNEDAPLARGWQDRQREFLARHLQRWSVAFARRLALIGAHPYYRALADLTVRFLEADSLELAPSDLLSVR
ncbi:MAG TPA: molecular chaperone TorD family protein [Anaerolineales bacterium]|nr:molecular chaperone TorD family protein [Anaerolineales bacterium]